MINLKIMQGSEAILTYYDNNFGIALEKIYPNIGLDSSKFKFMQKRIFVIGLFYIYYLCHYFDIFAEYWKDEDNQRAFFMEVANQKGINTQVASDWYSISLWDILRQQVLFFINDYYKIVHILF